MRFTYIKFNKITPDIVRFMDSFGEFVRVTDADVSKKVSL